MGDRIPPGSYFQYPPGLPASPIRSSTLPSDRERYLAELLAEKQKLGPFLQVLPLCSRLLNQEIRRISSFNQSFVGHERLEHENPLRSIGQPLNGRAMDLEGWPTMHVEENGQVQRMAPVQNSPISWPGLQGVPTTPIVKRVIRFDVPVEKYPNYNFVGRILGPRGNSLKRVEAMTECRVYIRGRGSVKDSLKEEKLKDKPGYEHLNEPLHVLVEAEFPEDIINARLDYAVTILEKLLKPVV
ncbi:KH domain-containing protein At1g09660/At1g09670-like isoform X2 [Juglans microcarpa x Juglans regia]|uniref:KH domain-containing protein At1g09660/At1g09670-like isoform X2 n=1 Tax=Juglans microcarpa x Juglans regia TaxID=2249226 RepID=UPI001B7E488E|nr:KH domain-containing protein At1g09660/At1g09670-like isoform X2 [Juglans microcarpa x Juglans regia]